jgi:hypothetical protein
MAFDIQLADRVREYLAGFPQLELEEKTMFSGLCFMVNGKMCVCVSGDKLMCRFDPGMQDTLSEHAGYLPMVMKGRIYKGYCYVSPEHCRRKKDFLFWVDLCLAFNERAKPARKRKQ